MGVMDVLELVYYNTLNKYYFCSRVESSLQGDDRGGGTPALLIHFIHIVSGSDGNGSIRSNVKIRS